MIFDVRDFGAKGDGVTLNTVAIQKAIDACAEQGGGRVLIENGTYMTGTVILHSFVNLHIEANAVLLGSPDCADYPEHEAKHVESKLLPRWRNACLIYADECENIALTGLGTIDCNGMHFVRELSPEERNGWKCVRLFDRPSPPRAVFFTGCKNVKIEDVTMINQPAGWSYWIHDCDYVTCDKLKINAEVEYPNNDGIHINSSRNVTVSNCSITCGDDCLVIRANNVTLKENKVCERVVITNCNLTSYSSGIRIAWMNDGVIRNCSVSNCVMTECTTGINIMFPYLGDPDPVTTKGSDKGREATLIENITFSDIVMDKQCGLPIKMLISERPEVMCEGIRNIYFNNIHSRGPSLPQLTGRKDCHFENIWFNNCSFECTDGTEFEDRKRRGAPKNMGDGGINAMVVRYIDGLKLNNTEISTL